MHMAVSAMLVKAREYEKKNGYRDDDRRRPLFHITPATGWLNDPNGFSWYNGQFHLFYQYWPYEQNWGPMHWGHCVSDDLVNWKRLPCAIAPDSYVDAKGCFSGSAIEYNGQHLLFYTGVMEDHLGNILQQQCAALGNGVDYEKVPGNPVITSGSLPLDGHTADFRDPKIVRTSDGYEAYIVNQSSHGTRVLVYRGNDPLNLTYSHVLCSNESVHISNMWECTDYFDLDGKKVLLLSCQDSRSREELPSGDIQIALVGHEENGMFIPESRTLLDYGPDYYAANSLLHNGRRVTTAWMQNWDSASEKPKDFNWMGQLSLIRELHIKDNHVIQTPVSTLSSLHKNYEEKTFSLNSETTDTGWHQRTMDLEITMEAQDKDAMFVNASIRFAQGHGHEVSLTFRPWENMVEMNREKAGVLRRITNISQADVQHDHGTITMRLVLDRYSAEVFINNGERVMSMVFYTPLEDNSITITAAGKARITLKKYNLEER